jgi:hypothetical protein
VKDFKAQTHIETTTAQEDHTLHSIKSTQEGLQNDKPNMKHPTIIPNTILPKQKKTKAPQT